MQLHARRATARTGLDLTRVRADEQRHPAIRRSQPLTSGPDPVELASHVQPALGGDLLAPLGDQAHLFGAHALDDAEHLVGDGGFEVERHAKTRLQAVDIVVADVAAVFAQMKRDDVRTRFDRKFSGFDWIGVAAAARIAQGGDMVDVDAQQGHR